MSENITDDVGGTTAFEITALTKADGPLTKAISLSPEGALKSDGSACVMWRGSGQRVRFSDLEKFVAFIGGLGSDQALALGALRSDLPDAVRITTEVKLASINGTGAPDLIARSGEFISYRPGQPALALIDIDTKAMPGDVKAQIDAAGGYLPTLFSVLPALQAAGRVVRNSTSSGIVRSDTGDKLPGSDGMHVYVRVKDGADIKRFLRTFHERCWLHGLGWIMVDIAGRSLERSLIDTAVSGAERIVFEGAPVLEAPLVQDVASRTPQVVEGEALDTRAACPDLNAAEKAQFDRLVADAKRASAEQAAVVREAYITTHAAALAERTGMPATEARRVIEQQTRGVLLPDVLLLFDDPELAGATVGDVLADPARFVDETLADPLEGVAYGRCKAKVLRRRDGSIFIHSFAHGRTDYELRYDARAIEAAIMQGGEREAADIFVEMLLLAELEADDEARLKKLVTQRSGVTARPLNAKIKEARARHAEQRRAEERTEHPDVTALVEELDGKHFVVCDAGKTLVVQPLVDPETRRLNYPRSAFSDFRNKFLNRQVVVATGTDGVPIHRGAADVWLRHPKRKQYLGGFVFDPSGKMGNDNVYNLWHGFSVEPKAGSWALMQGHMLTVICAGNVEHYTYLFNWFARMIQHPDEQGEIAAVLKGVEGSGKGTLLRALLRMLGQHGLQISNPKHLVGSFNEHLRDLVFMFVDEAFYAGDVAHVGVLKALVTEEWLMIEPKYVNAQQARNHLHIVMATNSEWAIPAGLEARRFFVLDVLPTRVGDFDYFEKIEAEMRAGGDAAMLHDLLKCDLTGFNVRDFPKTEALGEQKKLTMNTTLKWLADVLQRGYVLDSRHGLAGIFTEWMPEVTTALLYLSYRAFADRVRERHPISREALGRFMATANRDNTVQLAKPCRISNAIIGEQTVREPHDMGYTVSVGKEITKERAGGYALGSLDDARAAFVKVTGLTVEWDDDGADEAAKAADKPPAVKVQEAAAAVYKATAVALAAVKAEADAVAAYKAAEAEAAAADDIPF